MKILVSLLFVLSLTSCYKPPSNEISEMAERCFQHRQAIRIEFTPIPELDHQGKEEKIK